MFIYFAYMILCCDLYYRYGCQVRNILREATKQDVFLRAGDFWYRNVVHGRPLTDGSKGKRYGHPLPKGHKANEVNNNLYMGTTYGVQPQ
jgi:hypothetical protein